jgi:lysophospholipase L1-like esterase
VIAAKLALAPLLLWQGQQVRRRALRLPEAAGPRTGVAGDGAGPPVLRLLVVGDSSAAGVGVPTQDEALAAPLARGLSQRLGGPVAWQLVATSGHAARDALQTLQATPDLAPADVLLVVLGVNDAVALTRTRPWLATLDALHAHAVAHAGVRWCWHSALPPMGRFPLLPQPLRWVLGREAERLDRALRRHVQGRADRRWVALPQVPAGVLPAGWMADDGYHPGPMGYAAWAGLLADEIASVARTRTPLTP